MAANPDEAVQWFRRAAEVGHTAAQHSLAVRYENGQGVAKDPEEAVRWSGLSKAGRESRGWWVVRAEHRTHAGGVLDVIHPPQSCLLFPGLPIFFIAKTPVGHHPFLADTLQVWS